jgi:hypothetical protein
MIVGIMQTDANTTAKAYSSRNISMLSMMSYINIISFLLSVVGKRYLGGESG